MNSRNSSLLSVLFAALIQLPLYGIAEAQQPSLFVAGALGVGSSGTVQQFNLPASQDEQGKPIATLPGFVEAVACGPDGNLYVSLSGYGCCSPARQIWRISLDGKTQTKILDFDTTPVTSLQSSGGPLGMRFGPDGSLFFNTNASHQNTLFATGVWKLPAATSAVPGTSSQVILPFTSPGGSGSDVAFLKSGDLIAGEATSDYFTHANRVVRVKPPFEAQRQELTSSPALRTLPASRLIPRATFLSHKGLSARTALSTNTRRAAP